ncbi:MAG: DUF1175 family protein [Synergistetes bacterium]|nr:DUF1175 family protein [Synergistota bacterium]
MKSISISVFVLLILLLTPPVSTGSNNVPAQTASDFNQNGFPDVTELYSENDVISFRRWFVNVAVSQYYHTSRFWDEKNRDCAGLVRFSFVEALMKHTNKWCRHQEFILYPDVPDVRKYNYPDVPILGKRVFRIKGGIYKGTQDFSKFATARLLVDYNMQFVSRNLKKAQIGDILAFYHPSRDVPYHLMIYVGTIDGKRYVVYHTGSKKYGMRLITVENLKRHPDASWHPIPINKDFLGVFSWKILH